MLVTGVELIVGACKEEEDGNVVCSGCDCVCGCVDVKVVGCDCRLDCF